MVRFTKAAVLAFIDLTREQFEATHGFDPRNGWAQVEGRGEAVNRDYGAYSVLRDLADCIENGDLPDTKGA